MPQTPEQRQAAAELKRQRNREYMRDRRLADPEKARSYQQNWRAANQEKARAYGRAYRERHPERADASAKRWREQNPERYRTARKAYLKANADKLKEQARARRALKPSGSPAARRVEALKRNHGMTPGDWAAMWTAQDGRCYLCEKPMDPARMISIDHDHRCCQQGSCASCRRGLTHQRCNSLIGNAGDDPALLRKIAANLEAASARQPGKLTLF